MACSIYSAIVFTGLNSRGYKSLLVAICERSAFTRACKEHEIRSRIDRFYEELVARFGACA
jgi:hypothetical protein